LNAVLGMWLVEVVEGFDVFEVVDGFINKLVDSPPSPLHSPDMHAATYSKHTILLLTTYYLLVPAALGFQEG